MPSNLAYSICDAETKHLVCGRNLRQVDLHLRRSGSAYCATCRHDLRLLGEAYAADEYCGFNMAHTSQNKWLKLDGQVVHGRNPSACSATEQLIEQGNHG